MRDFPVSLPPHTTHVKFFEKKTSFSTNIDAEKVLCVFDSTTRGLFGDLPYPCYTIPPGEKYKSRETVEKISAWALSEGAARDAVFLAAGGGVVCDITAFAASIYMRGVPVILVPTTLLSMVDASIGGKTGINFEGFKNILGTFYPAREVRIIPEVLKTLTDREFFSGLAEVIKHGLLLDGALFRIISERSEEIIGRDNNVLEEIIYHSLKVKQWYIEQDPREMGIRGHLNLGHTFGHALESIGGFSRWTHGEAVAWGIAMAMRTGVLMGLTDQNYAREVERILPVFGYRTDFPNLNVENLIAIMRRDKKKKDGKVKFILQKKHAETFFSEVPENILRMVLG